MEFLSLITTYPSTLIIQLADKFVVHLLNYLHVIPNSNIKSCLELHPRKLRQTAPPAKAKPGAVAAAMAPQMTPGTREPAPTSRAVRQTWRPV